MHSTQELFRPVKRIHEYHRRNNVKYLFIYLLVLYIEGRGPINTIKTNNVTIIIHTYSTVQFNINISKGRGLLNEGDRGMCKEFGRKTKDVKGNDGTDMAWWNSDTEFNE